MTHARVLSENPIRLTLCPIFWLWLYFDSSSFDVWKPRHWWRHCDKRWVCQNRNHWELKLQTYFFLKNGKNRVHFVMAIFLKNPSQNRVEHFSSLHFRFILRIQEKELFFNNGIEFCHGKMTFFGCFLLFYGQKVIFPIRKRYENLWFPENKIYIQTFAERISLIYWNLKEWEFYQTDVRFL